ncbi:MAG: isochorismatase family protein [Chloroflexi bacterium]|nr:isochorismatase family protein [Chloroflexota bacterium]
MKRWLEIYTEQDRQVLGKSGMGSQQTFGQRPVFIIIDTNWRTLGPRGKEILDAMDTSRGACGASGWEAVKHAQRLLGACRDASIPVIFVTGDAITRVYQGRTSTKGQVGALNLAAEEMPEEIAPLPSELVIRKTRASGFFDTPLDNCLKSLKADCLLVAGNSTSGCVRASVIDAWSHGHTVFLVEECCYDRFELSHLVNLFDMNAKYADVISIDDALEHVAAHAGRQKVPAGRA